MCGCVCVCVCVCVRVRVRVRVRACACMYERNARMPTWLGVVHVFLFFVLVVHAYFFCTIKC